MATNYERIRKKNRRAYGEVGASKYGKHTSQSLYADRTHFIFELLQNAEDALERRGDAWNGDRQVEFILSEDQLRYEHSGDPFNEEDVRAICEFDESTKHESLTQIGRFGIGFKSVFAYTSEPRIYSGDENFAIRDYIFPYEIEQEEGRNLERTVILLPLGEGTSSQKYDEIARGLATLHRRTLLFLKNIEGLSWRTRSGTSGQYLRKSRQLEDGVRRATLIAQDHVDDEVVAEDWAEDWIVFSRLVTRDGASAGRVQVSFLLDSKTERVRVAKHCTLFARFPTGLATDMGLLMDGPYRTTPDRDGIPSQDPWNTYLLAETSELLIQSLRWLRDKGLLDAEALRCLPLVEPEHRPDLLRPIFHAAIEVLRSEALLPRHGGGYVTASRALLPRPERLRDLFSSDQLSRLYQEDTAWLDSSLDSATEVQRFLERHLNVPEIRPEGILRRLSTKFLEEQSDSWIRDLYQFLEPRRALHRDLSNIPIIRLKDGSHATPRLPDGRRVFLPIGNETDYPETDYPTVRRSVSEHKEARSFLRSMGLREWDQVDDLMDNVLRRYKGAESDISEAQYGSDMRRVADVWKRSDDAGRRRLRVALEESFFVRAVDAADATMTQWCKPSEVYLASARLFRLFSGVAGVKLVDRRLEVLDDDTLNGVFEACGMSDSLKIVTADGKQRFSKTALRKMRCRVQKSNGLTAWKGQEIVDWSLLGLDNVLATLSSLDIHECRARSQLIWELVTEVDRRRFEGTYSWFYYRRRLCRFPSSLVVRLRESLWVPDPDGQLLKPEDVLFEELGWIRDEFMLSQIRFRPPISEQIANEVGLSVDEIQYLQEWKRQGGDFRDLKAALPVSVDKFTHDRRRSDQNDAAGNFAGALLKRQATDPVAQATPSSVRLPSGGPMTAASARRDRVRSSEVAHHEGWRVTEVSHSELGPEGKALDVEFRAMVGGDYGRRCQVCGRTFAKANLEQQVFVIHLAPPAQHSSFNYFGNLVGLCGWHFALIQHGQWHLQNNDGRPIEDEEDLRNLIIGLPEQVDDAGNTFRGLPIRFWNVQDGWADVPVVVDAVIRYSNPHWRYLCEALRGESQESS